MIFRPGTSRENVRGLVVVRDDASGATGAFGAEVQAQGGRARGMDSRKRRDAHVPTLPAMQVERTEGPEEEARGLRIGPRGPSGPCGTNRGNRSRTQVISDFNFFLSAFYDYFVYRNIRVALL